MTDRKIILRRTLTFLGVLAMCFLTVHYGRHYVLQVWSSLRVVNFIVNLTPTILSILFAFVVDKDLEGRMKTLWRIFIVFCGLTLSGLLWHQQTLADTQSNKQIQAAVNDAVTKSNAHSDAHSDQKIGDVEAEIGGVKTDLQTTDQSLAVLLASSKDIKTEVGKVGVPTPPELAKLQFSLWNGAGTIEPLESQTIQQNIDGSFSYQFVVRNLSSVQAQNVQIWISICTQCTYVEKPQNFEHVEGVPETELIRRDVADIDPGAAWGPVTVKIKLYAGYSGQVPVSFGSTCKNCGSYQTTKPYLLQIGYLATQ